MEEEKWNPLKRQKQNDDNLDFHPILFNTFDDETTLEEEEALEPTEDPQTELQNLKRESEIPIDQLLKYYTSDITKSDKGDNLEDNKTESSLKRQPEEKETAVKTEVDCEDEEEEQEDEEMDEETPQRSALSQLYDNYDAIPGTSRPQRSTLRPQSDEDEDRDYSPDEEELKKTIMVGCGYQAVIPEGLSHYDDALPYENEDKLLWNPALSSTEIEKYLIKAREANFNSANGVGAIPMGAHTRDDEQALYLLLQCNYITDEALRRIKMNVSGPQDEMSIWSEEECCNFEAGLRTYGKNFRQIQSNKVRTRKVGELVQFYYLWKKTERHDLFANKARLEKKKYTLHPGITDYMDRFLEDQDSAGGTDNGNSGNPSRDRSCSPNVQCLIYTDSKRQNRRSASPMQMMKNNNDASDKIKTESGSEKNDKKIGIASVKTSSTSSTNLPESFPSL